MPFPSRSTPRPPDRTVVALPLLSVITTLLRGPYPWPATLIATVAKPAWAKTGETIVGPPKLLSPNPWPKITTG
jgi:hypothetical protein